MSRLLLVDDETSVLNMTREALEGESYDIDCAQTEAGAIRFLETDKYEIVLLDYKIGNDNGVELAKKISARWPESSMIMITAYPSDTVRVDALCAGVDSILQKPVDIGQLKAVMRQATISRKRKRTPEQHRENQKNVLIVDDSPTYRKMVKQSVALYPEFNIMEAEDGLAALEKMDGNDVKLIFLDYNMPRMNGIEFMKEVRANPTYKNIPIIMLTTEAEEGKMVKGYMSGATIYLTKPFLTEALTKVVDTMRYWHMK